MLNYCYKGYIKEFLSLNNSDWLQTMKKNFLSNYNVDLDDSQIKAWEDCFYHMKRVLEAFSGLNYFLIFEYSLPHEGGRRPDVILLGENDVIVLEFKMKKFVLPADVDQLANYIRDISDYHYESRGKKRYAFLVLTKAEKLQEFKNNVICCSPDRLFELMRKALGNELISDPHKWLNSKYQPLPSIVEAAKLIMTHEELPFIRTVNNTGIPRVAKLLHKISNKAMLEKEYILVFVTGVPGAGKTFLGLQYIYDRTLDTSNVDSIYLSRNGPLVNVLSDALKSKVFVRNIQSEIQEYFEKGDRSFHYHVIVFDEGQRIWDKYRVSDRYHVKDMTEADMLMEMATSNSDWCVLVVLIGEGQEINKGERYGIKSFSNAMKKDNKTWKVICPPKLDSQFKNSEIIDDQEREILNLDISIRSHRAGNVSKLINHIISSEIEQAKLLFDDVTKQGYNIWITRDLNTAKDYCLKRYLNEPKKRFGLLASSKAKNLNGYVDNSYENTSKVDLGKWYNRNAGEEGSCCNLKDPVVEFGCQGLELDMPIICWGNDLKWSGNKWDDYISSEPSYSQSNIYRFNSYRVLLTRGRDGFIIFIPKESNELDKTYNMFVSDMGFLVL